MCCSARIGEGNIDEVGYSRPIPAGALLAPLLAEAVLPEAVLGTTLGGLATAGLGGALGAGTGAAFGELTGEGAGKGALSGAIGGAAGPLGGLAGEAVGVGSTVGSIVGAGAGGALGAEVTGGNPILGAAESAAVPAINAGFSGGLGAAPSTGSTSAPATGSGSAGSSAGSIGASSAAGGSSIPLDPTAGSSGTSSGVPGGAGISSAGTSGGGNVDSFGAMGLQGSPGFGVDPQMMGLGGQAGFGAATTPGASPGGFLSGLGDKAMGLLEHNPGALLSGGLLASQLFRGNEAYPAEKSLQTLGTNAATEGQALAGYLNSGTLPPGAQQAVSSATNAAKATMRSTYAKMGLSGSTMEAQALQEADRQAATRARGASPCGSTAAR